MARKKEIFSELDSAELVLQKILGKDNTALSLDFKRFRLKLVWDKVVGKEIASCCNPKGFNKGILFLSVDSSAALQRLSYMKTEIVNKVNKFLGEEWVLELRLSLATRFDRAKSESNLDQ